MMKILPAAAVIALGLSTPAFAQFTLYGTDVPEDQVTLLQEHCDALLADDSTDASEGATATDPTNTDNSVGSFDFSTMDITTVTRSDCRDGGFMADDVDDSTGS